VFLLDTNVVSELRKSGTPQADELVTIWAGQVDSGDLYISSITALELEIGIQRMARRDQRQGKVLRRWFIDRVLPAFSGRILPFDSEAAVRCARYHIPDPRPDRDSFIAAIAEVHGLTIVTRNVNDFRSFGLPILNPWEPL
jgi:toxin FitB